MTTPELIVHIGAGKTGSSSIQLTLRKNRGVLARQGVRYLGLMLEHCAGGDKQDWQFTSGSDLFFALRGAERTEALFGVLQQELAHPANANIARYIWSNEWLFGRHEAVIPALKRLQAGGVRVRIVCYLRGHDKWVRSAYAQWGIKHKSYKGRIRSFAKWFNPNGVRFLSALRPWLDAFPDDTVIRNFDAAPDVVDDFLTLFNLDLSVRENDNVSPGNEVLAAWAVYNSRYEREIPPGRFLKVLRRARLLDEKAVFLPPLQELMPSAADLARVRDLAADDLAGINAVLTAQGQPPLDLSQTAPKPAEIDQWRMNQVLLALVFSLSDELERISQKLEAPER